MPCSLVTMLSLNIGLAFFRFFSIFNEQPFVLVLTMALASAALARKHRRARRAPILSALARARAVCNARGLALALASTSTRALAIAAPSACDPDDDHIELCCTMLASRGPTTVVHRHRACGVPGDRSATSVERNCPRDVVLTVHAAGFVGTCKVVSG